MLYEDNYLAHYGIKGQKWGVRRFQNEDGTLTPEGKERYSKEGKDNYDVDRMIKALDDKFKYMMEKDELTKQIDSKLFKKQYQNEEGYKILEDLTLKRGEVLRNIRKCEDILDEYSDKHRAEIKKPIKSNIFGREHSLDAVYDNDIVMDYEVTNEMKSAVRNIKKADFTGVEDKVKDYVVETTNTWSDKPLNKKEIVNIFKYIKPDYWYVPAYNDGKTYALVLKTTADPEHNMAIVFKGNKFFEVGPEDIAFML